jgi:Alkyl sulfatase and related hydrolases
MKRLGYFFIIAMTFSLGIAFERSRLNGIVKEGADFIFQSARRQVSEIANLDTRTQILLENPRLLSRIALGGGFGGEYSLLAAKNMFSRLPNVIEDIKNKTKIIEIAERTYLIRLPIVNVVLFETDEGNVLVDTGMAPAGPAIYESIRKINDLPIHSVIYTHGHVDHAYGTWAIIEEGETPEIIAHKNLRKRFTRYVRLRGSIAKYMSQPEEQLPTSKEDFTWPTKEFENRLELNVGGRNLRPAASPR